MLVIFIAAGFCVLNISLWIVFFSKFRNLFSTDDIIASTREEMERMISDINHNAGRNIEIIEDRIRQLKAVIAEADRHIETARLEIEKQKEAIAYQKKIETVRKTGQGTNQIRSADQYMKNMPQNNPILYSDISTGLQSVNVYELTPEGSRHAKQPLQGDLFAQAEQDAKEGHIPQTEFTVESDGSSHASIPLIGGNVAYADEPVKPQRDFRDMVKDLHFVGHSVEEIARELNRSTTEVQLVLDMG